MLTRRGWTLIELIVAMTVGGVALALIAVISVRQQRLYADVADRAALTGQLRQASAVLPIELRAASPGAGDIREARDTAIELRSSIATAVVCDTLDGSIVLAPASPGAAAFAGYLTAIASGDTAWVLARGDTADAWIPYAVSSVSSVAPGPCGPLGPRLNPTALVSRRVAIRLDPSGPIANVAGSVFE
jgi:prepilin-type N-terminal cleavage/methylation domain-containing protein